MARPRQAQLPAGMVLVRLYLFLHGMVEAKCQLGKVRPHRREKNVLAEPIREHQLQGAQTLLLPTSPSSLGGRLSGG